MIYVKPVNKYFDTQILIYVFSCRSEFNETVNLTSKFNKNLVNITNFFQYE